MHDLPSLIDKAHAVKLGVCIPGAGCDLSWGGYVEAFYSFSIKAGGVLVVLMMVYAGYIYLSSQGDSAKLTAAKDIIFGALTGYILLLLSGMLLNYIGIK